MSGRTVTGVCRRRCFLALLPDAAGRAALQRGGVEAARAVAGDARSVRWTEPGALHLTLRFLGASTPAQVDHVQRALLNLGRALPKIAARRYGIWPNRARPRMLVLELEGKPALAALAAECEELSCAAGYEPERRDFRAHVTLARLRPGCAFGTSPTPHFGVGFDRIALMESTLGRPTAVYAAIASAAIPRA